MLSNVAAWQPFYETKCQSLYFVLFSRKNVVEVENQINKILASALELLNGIACVIV